MKKENILAAMMFGGSGSGGGGGSVAPIETTYSELKALRDGGNLQPGALYRMTDYVTKISGYYDLSALGASGKLFYGKSAEHPFDLILLAVDESHLSENALAAQHEGDTYFSNSNLGAWEIKYTLDNDPGTYTWADATNGKGVIYWLKDEFNNEAGYDFKNIQLLRYALSLDANAQGYTPADGGLVYNASTQPNRYGGTYQIFQALMAYMQGGTYVNPFKRHYDFAVSYNILGVIQATELNATYLSTFGADLYYTFDYYDALEGTHADLSLNNGEQRFECRNNYIAQTCDSLLGTALNEYAPQGLNGSVWELNSVYATGKNYVGCVDNQLASSCFLNTFGGNSFNNQFAMTCYGNIFGDNCNSNTFGSDCNSNTFGSDCQSNTFGRRCYSNIFGSSCNSNTFGDNCYNNTFGDDFYSNTFGDNCDSNTFGDYCYNNTFGDDFYSNTLGDDFYANTLGDYCGSNTFGDYCNNNTISIGHTRHYHICDNVSSQILTTVANRTFETYIGYNSSGVLKTWCPADLV